MDIDSIWNKLKWIVIILFVIVLIFLFSILISKITEIDFNIVFAVLSVFIGGISLFIGYQYGKLIKESNKLNEKTNKIITRLEDAVKESKQIAEKSEKASTSVVNVEFLRLIGQIEDLRLDLKNSELVKSDTEDLSGKILFLPKLITKREIYGWKCYTYIREADSILHQCQIENEYIKRFLNIFNLYLEQIKIVRDNLGMDISFSVEEIHHLFMMFKRILKLHELFTKEDLKELDYQKKINKATDHLKYILRENEHVVIDLNYIIKMDNILDTIRKKNKGTRFYSVDEQIRVKFNRNSK